MLINVSPILIAVLAGVFLKEGFPRWLIIGSLVAFCGVALTSQTATPLPPNSSAIAWSLEPLWRATGQSEPVKNSTTAFAGVRRSS